MRTPSEVSATWPHKWFGFWAPPGELKTGDYPGEEEVFEPGWAGGELVQIERYLDSAPLVVAASADVFHCQFCGEALENSNAYRSDGKWLWPVIVTHFVAKHGFRVPDAAVADMRARAFEPPEQLDVAPADLPWPEPPK